MPFPEVGRGIIIRLISNTHKGSKTASFTCVPSRTQYSSSLVCNVTVDYQIDSLSPITVSQTYLSIYVNTWYLVKQKTGILAKHRVNKRGWQKHSKSKVVFLLTHTCRIYMLGLLQLLSSLQRNKISDCSFESTMNKIVPLKV